MHVEPRRLAGRQGRIAERRLLAAGGRPEPRRLHRSVAQGDVVGHGHGPERDPRQQRQCQRDGRARDQPPAPDRRPALEPPRDPEAAEQARGEQREQPWIGRLERRQKRPRTERQELVDDAGDRRHEAEQGQDPEPDDGREGDVAACDRRPDHTGQGDPDRCQGEQPDEEIERPAGPVGEQHEAGRDRPADDQGDADESQFEGADTHRA